jgi:hypothetical protein
MRKTGRIAHGLRWTVAAGGVGFVAGAIVAVAEPQQPHKGVSFVPLAPETSGLSSLSGAPPIRLEKAFGSQDEDCIYEIKAISRPGNGTLHRRKLICQQ